MIRTTIQAGVCGFCTTVKARSDDMQMVSLLIARPAAATKPLLLNAM